VGSSFVSFNNVCVTVSLFLRFSNSTFPSATQANSKQRPKFDKIHIHLIVRKPTQWKPNKGFWSETGSWEIVEWDYIRHTHLSCPWPHLFAEPALELVLKGNELGRKQGTQIGFSSCHVGAGFHYNIDL